MNTTPLRLIALVMASALPVFAQAGKPDAEGFIRDWLVLAPLSIGASSGADAIDQQQFATEAQPGAKEGAKQKAGDKELEWRKIATKQFYIDFREMHPNQGEQVVGWAVAYIVSPDDKSGLTLRMNSNDQGKVYLNGEEVIKFTEARALEKEMEDSATNITLKKGTNVLVLKVVNEENNWQGSVRFMTKTGRPVTDLTVATQP